MRFVGASDTPMTCHGPSHDPSSSALACPMALPTPESAQLGHMPRHGLEKANEEMMQAYSGGVKVHFTSTTIWPLAMTVLEEVNGKIVSGCSRDGMEEIGNTTT
ncbi:hypothetical protein CJ030_MR1G023375 [Morella rubra]|uniref:Uncharacterized protein n=1 Tax=Morella rubra TaxID=262757 RepID=A0A6A1WN60_9ROSI|nr:hypothetical protein CJ030_MR1G023375 [Morella rubra]